MRGSTARRLMMASTVVVLLGSTACIPPPNGENPAVASGTIRIDDGRPATNVSSTVLSFTRSSNVARMRVANGPDPSAAAWEPYAPVRSWTLPAGEGLKRVSAQFSDASGSVISAVQVAEIILDSTPPAIQISNVTSNQRIDISDGRLFPLSGTATDAGSGTERVFVDAGGQSFPATLDGPAWGRPVGAPTSGIGTFVATAVDRAGNTSSTQVQLDLVVPPPGDHTILRPGVRVLTGDLAEALSSVEPNQVRFSGDRRGVLTGITAIVAPPAVGPAVEGLMRLVDSVTYSVADQTTRVTTSPASIADVFARLKLSTVLPATGNAGGAGPAVKALVGSGSCAGFAEGKSVGFTTTLFDKAIDWTPTDAAWPGGAKVQARLRAELAAYVDVDIDLDIGWGGIDVRQFDVTGGALGCMGAGLSTDAELERTLGTTELVPFDEWDHRFRTSALSGLNFEIEQLSGDVGLPIPLPPPLPPLVLQPRVGVSISPELKPTTGMDVDGLVAFGAEGGVRGGDPFIAPHISADLAAWQADGSLSLATPATLNLGISLGDVGGLTDVSGDFVKTGFRPRLDLSATWVGDRVGPAGSKLSTRADVCVDYTNWVGAELSASFGIPGLPGKRVSVSLLSVTAGEMTTPLGCPFTRQWQADPTRIQTTSLPSTSVGDPYSAQLAASQPVTWSIVGGTLPPGLTLDSSTGAITGAATASGSSQVSITARSAGGGTDTLTTTITVYPPTGIAVGRAHACEMTRGTIRCWGDNSFGQLGNGSTVSSLVPVQVIGISTAVAIRSVPRGGGV